MSTKNFVCPNPHCQSENVIFSKKRNSYFCEDCEQMIELEKQSPKLKIFLSYGHDQNVALVEIIKNDLEKRGHDVWFDKSEIKSGDDWRRSIIEGISASDKVLSFLSKHATRDPGVCRDEIAIAIGVKGGNIQTILVESEEEVKLPVNIGHIQWLDMHDWKEKFESDAKIWKKWYDKKLTEIISVVESEKNKRFAGEIEKLSGYLKPIKSDARIFSLLKKGFIGREWLFEAIENKRNENTQNRLFWITGEPGVGKSAFAARLTHANADKVVAAQFVEWDKPDHRNSKNVIRSIAFQLATRLPDYRKFLLTLPEIKDLDSKNAAELFDYLLANPLNFVIDGGRERYLIVIDAIDEAGELGKNTLVELLARDGNRLPDWLGLIVTSRPDSAIKSSLQGLNPIIIDQKKEANRKDIRNYLLYHLADHLKDHLPFDKKIELILDKSEGVFLYVERFCEEVRNGNLSLLYPGQFPQGLGGMFYQYFLRQFPDQEAYEKTFEPILGAILAAREPLSLLTLQGVFGCRKVELMKWLQTLGSLFPVAMENGNKIIKPYHKSLVDWLVDEAKAGNFFVDITTGNQLLTKFLWLEFKEEGVSGISQYALRHLPFHLIKNKEWDKIIELLCNLNFIQAKAADKMTYELLGDFNEALDAIPDNAENIRIEKERQGRIKKYTQDLIACAKGEITDFELVMPDSIPSWTEDQVNAEIERRKYNPTLADKLYAFLNFLGHEATNLQNYAHELPYLTIQQAWNSVADGPVGEAAQMVSTDILRRCVLQVSSSRPTWNPLPMVIKKITRHAQGAAVDITPNGEKIVSASHPNNTCIMWDADTGKLVKTFFGHSDAVNSIVITPDGKRAVSASNDKTCILWDTETGKALKTLSGHTAIVNYISVTPNGKTAVSASDDNSCIVWNLETGNPLKILSGHTESVRSVAITPDAKIAVSASNDNTCIVWNIQTGKALKILTGHTKWVYSVSITPDGKRAVSASWDNTCILWDIQEGKALKTLRGHKGPVKSAAITPDGKRVISASLDGTGIDWEVESGKVLKRLLGHSGFVECVAVTPDARRAVSASGNNTFIVWDLERAIEKKTPFGHTSLIPSLAVTPDGKRAISVSWDKTCVIWDMETGKAIKSLSGHTHSINSVAVTPNGKNAISASFDKTCIVWDMETGMQLRRFVGHSSIVWVVGVTPDGKSAVSSSGDKSWILWNLKTGKALKTFFGHEGSVHTIAVAPEGKRAVSASGDNTCILWDLESGRLLKKLSGHTDFVKSVAIAPDGRSAVSGSSDNNCILWDLETGEILNILIGHTGSIFCVAVTPDGRRAVSASDDKTCIVWDIKTGKALKILSGHTDIVRYVTITPDGKSAISVSHDNTCIVWDLDLGIKIAHFIAHCQLWAVASTNRRICIGGFSSKVFFLECNGQSILNKRLAIATVRQIWDTEKQRFQKVSADCPLCGHRFSPTRSTIQTIKEIVHKAELCSIQSSCLDLPDEAWENPDLLFKCPNCKKKLKLNPFVAGSEY